MDHHLGVGQGKTLALLPRCQNNRRCRCRNANAHRGHIGLDVIHRVEHSKAGSNRAAGGVDIKLDVFFRILALQKEELGDDQVGGVVLNRRRSKK